MEGEHDERGLPPMVSEQPTESLKKKRQKSPFLTGVNSAETSRAILGNHVMKFRTIFYEIWGCTFRKNSLRHKVH